MTTDTPWDSIQSIKRRNREPPADPIVSFPAWVTKPPLLGWAASPLLERKAVRLGSDQGEGHLRAALSAEEGYAYRPRYRRCICPKLSEIWGSREITDEEGLALRVTPMK